jgi:hypothetical protein
MPSGAHWESVTSLVADALFLERKDRGAVRFGSFRANKAQDRDRGFTHAVYLREPAQKVLMETAEQADLSGHLVQKMQGVLYPCILAKAHEVLCAKVPRKALTGHGARLGNFDIRQDVWAVVDAIPDWAFRCARVVQTDAYSSREEFLASVSDASRTVRDKTRNLVRVEARPGPGTVGEAVEPEVIQNLRSHARNLKQVKLREETERLAGEAAKAVRRANQAKAKAEAKAKAAAEAAAQAGRLRKAEKARLEKELALLRKERDHADRLRQSQVSDQEVAQMGAAVGTALTGAQTFWYGALGVSILALAARMLGVLTVGAGL